MTVNYTANVATCGPHGCFAKLLLRWRGSIYKLIWRDLSAFLVVYHILSFIYRFVLNKDQQLIFETIRQYCGDNSRIPVSFVLGFYVMIIMARWWNQYILLPRPDSTAVLLSGHLHGHDIRGRIMRRTIVRYLCFAFALSMTRISPSVKRRFPTLDHLVDAGFLVEQEKVILLDLEKWIPKLSKHWVPVMWAVNIISRARREGRIRDDYAVQSILAEINKFRGKCGSLMNFDNIGIPLVYTQVVCLAVYSYFFFNLMNNQWVDVPDEEGFAHWVDKYFPFFTVLEFFFFMGWLKVAEVLINPFGDDDDDFEINWLIDRHLKVSYLIVDEMHHNHPELVRDQYWDVVFPAQIRPSYGKEERYGPPEASTAKIGLAKESFGIYGRLSNLIARHSRARASSSIRSTLSEITLRQVGVVYPQPHEYSARKSLGIMRSVELKSESVSTSSSGTLILVQDAIGNGDDFQRLRNERENERLRKQQVKMLRAIENVTNKQNISSILSIMPERYWAVSDSEKSSAESADELKVVADAQDMQTTTDDAQEKQTTSEQRDAFDRLKDERRRRRLYNQKRMLVRNVIELNDKAHKAEIIEKKRSAKNLPSHDEVAPTKRWKKEESSTSATSTIQNSERILSTKFFSSFFKPSAELAQPSTATAQQKPLPSNLDVDVDVEKTASTATLTAEDQAPSTPGPSMALSVDASTVTIYFDPSATNLEEKQAETKDKEQAPAQTTEQLTQAKTKPFSMPSADRAAQSSTAPAQQKSLPSKLNVDVEKAASTTTLTPVGQALPTRPVTIYFDPYATSQEDAPAQTTWQLAQAKARLFLSYLTPFAEPAQPSTATPQQQPSSSKLNVDVKKTVSTATLTPEDQAPSTSGSSMALSVDTSIATIYFDPSATSLLEKQEETRDEKGAPAQTTRQLMHADTRLFSKTVSTATSNATLYSDPSATSLEEKQEEIRDKEDATALTASSMTQGQSILPVPSEESIYYDPSEISLVASEDKNKKKDSKSNK